MRDLSRGATSRFTFEPGNDFSPVWSPAGSRIAYSGENMSGRRGPQAAPLLAHPICRSAPALLPEPASGRPEIYVQAFPGPGGKWQVSAGGSEPRWRRDGKELFYLAGDLKMMSVEVS